MKPPIPAPKILSPAPIPPSSRNTSGSLPKVNRNDVMKAVNATFVRPAIQKVTSGFQTMNPINVARSWASANPVTSKIMDFKANLDDNRQERDRPNREARAAFGSANDNRTWREARMGGGGDGEGGGGMSAMTAQSMINVMEKILDSNTSGFATVTTELRSIRSNSITTVRNTNLMLQEQKKGTAAILELVENIKNMGAKPATVEDRIEARKATATDSEKGEKKGNPLLEMLQALAGIAMRFIGQMRMGAVLLMRSIRTGLAGLGSRISALFKGIRMPRALESLGATIGKAMGGFARIGKLFAPLGAVVGRIGAFLGPVMNALKPVLGLVGRLGGFLKFIPVIGQVLMLLMAAFDGIKGFIKGFSETDGNFMEKLWGGFKGAVTGIVKGLLSPFVWLGKLIWKGIKGLADLLGLDKLAESIGKIDFGELFSKIVKVFRPTGNMFGEIWKMVQDLVMGVWKKVKAGVTSAGNTVANAGETLGAISADVAANTSVALRNATRGGNSKAHEARVLAAAKAAGITDPNELAMFMAQTATETGGFNDADLEENQYSGRRVWEMRGDQLRRHGVTREQVMAADGNKDAMFEFMYSDKYRSGGSRLGNTQNGDGSRYRGRGYMQLTGRSNYRAMGQKLGLDLENNPELAADPAVASRIATQFWKDRGVAAAGRAGNVEAATRLVNGGTNGLSERRSYFQHYRNGGLASIDTNVTAAPRTGEQQRNLTAAEQREQRRRERMAMVGRTPEAPNAPPVVVNNNTTNNGGAGGAGNRTRYRRGNLDGYSSWADPVRGAS